MQGLDDEGEKSFELVSKLQDQFDKLGISLVDGNGQLRSSYDILYDLNGQWGSLDKNTKLYIAEIIAGKNQVDVFNALMSNFNSVISANETAMNSAGSAAKENAAYMESLEAKVSALKQTFQELSTALIDDDVAGVVLDIANSFLELVNTPVGRILAIGTAFTTVAFAANSLWKAMDLGTKFVGFLTGGAGLAGGLAALNPYLIITLGLITALVAFSPQIKDFFDGLKDPVGNATKKLEENAAELETSKKKLEELEATPWYDRTPEIQNEIKELEKYIDTLEKANEQLNKQKLEAAKKEYNKSQERSSFSGYGVYHETKSIYETEDFSTIQEALNWIEAVYGELYKTVEEAEEAGYIISENFERAQQSAEDYYSVAVGKQAVLNSKVEYGIQLTDKETIEWKKNHQELSRRLELINIIEAGTGELDEAMQREKATIISLISRYEESNQKLVEHDKALRISANGIKITAQQAQDFIAVNAQLSDSIGELNGQFYMEEEALYSLADAGNASARSIVQAKAEETRIVIEQVKKQIIALEELRKEYLKTLEVGVQTGLIDDITAEKFYKNKYRGEATRLEDILRTSNAELDLLEARINSWNGNPLGDSTKDKGSGSKKEKDILEDLKKQLSEMAHQAFLLDKQDAEANAEAIVQIYKQMQEAVKTKADELRAKGYSNTSDEIMELQKLWWGYSDEIKKVYDQIAATQKKFLDESEKALKAHFEKESARYKKLADQQQEIRDGYQDQADAYKIYANFVKDSIDEQIKVYQKEIDALEKANEERENEIALQEKLNNLAKAKSTQVMVYKDGKFQYTNDIDAVSSAQNDLNEYQRERQLEKEKQYWQDKIDALEKYKDEWNDFTRDYEDSANMQLLIQSGLFTAEDLIFSNRIKSAQNFADKYTEAMNRAMEAAKRMEEYQKLAAKYAESASNIGGSGTDWSQAWRDVDAAQKAGAISNAEAEALKQYYHSEKTKEMAGTGATFNPGTGTWSGGSSSGSGSSSGGSSIGSIIGSIGKAIGNGLSGLIKGAHADGTMSAPGGISLVGEGGPEMRVLNSGDGIIPADVTKNLWAMGSNPYAFVSNAYKSLAGTNSGDTTYQFAIDKLELPNAKDAPSLVEGLRNFAHQYSTQRT